MDSTARLRRRVRATLNNNRQLHCQALRHSAKRPAGPRSLGPQRRQPGLHSGSSFRLANREESQAIGPWRFRRAHRHGPNSRLGYARERSCRGFSPDAGSIPATSTSRARDMPDRCELGHLATTSSLRGIRTPGPVERNLDGVVTGPRARNQPGIFLES